MKFEDYYWNRFDVLSKDTQLARQFGQDVWDYKQAEIDALQKRIDELEAKREGFVLVPKEPSVDLVNLGHQVFLGHFNEGGQSGGNSLYYAYKAMLLAVEGKD